MKVIFAIPCMEGGIKARCHQSLVKAYHLLQLAGIPYDESILENCGVISAARNVLAARFLDDKDATDLFFIDSDVGFPPEAVVKLLERPEDIVGGVYPLKREEGGFPVAISTEDGVPLGREGLIEGKLLPGGFLRIKRRVFELMAEAHPELKYESSVVWVDGWPIQDCYDFFGLHIYSRQLRTEDYAFCQRWRDMGGQVWVYPDINFEHVGQKVWTANYHEYLLNLPGGAKSDVRLQEAIAIPGWMSPSELIWLAVQAKAHKTIVELGCFCGRSTRVLADNTQGKVYAVDDWQGPRDQQWDEDVRQQLTAEFAETLYLGFTTVMRDHIELGRVVPVRMNHVSQGWVWIPESAPDMIFVDGDHAYESAKRDIQYALLRLQPGGLLCGHDRDWPGVKQAVAELLPGAVNVPNTSLWAYIVPTQGEKHELPKEVHASQR